MPPTCRPTCYWADDADAECDDVRCEAHRQAEEYRRNDLLVPARILAELEA